MGNPLITEVEIPFPVLVIERAIGDWAKKQGVVFSGTNDTSLAAFVTSRLVEAAGRIKELCHNHEGPIFIRVDPLTKDALEWATVDGPCSET